MMRAAHALGVAITGGFYLTHTTACTLSCWAKAPLRAEAACVERSVSVRRMLSALLTRRCSVYTDARCDRVIDLTTRVQLARHP